VQAVLVSNDGTAGGVIQALATQNLVGKVWVTGMDADLPALQRIAEGRQSMTIYKPIKPLAERAAQAAISLAKGEQVQTTQVVNNGKKDVASILLDPIAVDKVNIVDTVVKDNYQKLEDIYKNVPKDQWPKAATARGGSVAQQGELLALEGRAREAQGGLLFSLFCIFLFPPMSTGLKR
jgi:D-xylose transport system substrate-binding protein